MKVMHLCTGYPISFNGGITNYVRSLAEEQVKMGMEVCVVSSPNEENDKYEFRSIDYKDFYLRPFSLRSKKGYIAYKKIEKIIKNEKPDLIHIHMILDVDRRLHRILKKYNIKYIVSLHDYSYLCPRIQMYRDGKVCSKVGNNCSACATPIEQTFLLNKICRVLKIDTSRGKKKSPQFLKIYENNKVLLENAEILLPVSNRVKEIYQKSNIHNKYEVLHIGNITADKFRKYTKRKRKTTDKIKILMLGNFSKIKGGQEFLKLANTLNSEKYEFYFLGRCTKEEEQQMKENNVINRGSYKQVDLPKLLKEYDFGCVLSIWEDNGPQVVMELLNNNVPVIGTLMGGIPDFVEDGKNGFLYNPYSKKSFDELVKKIKKISIDEIEKMKSSIKPTTTPQEHFNDINRIYNSLLK